MSFVRLIVLTAVGSCLVPPMAAAQKADRSAPASANGAGSGLDMGNLKALRWRNVGPFRGGRVTTVAGVPSQPLTYYMGSTGGGIWRTDDAGGNWRPIADGQIHMGSVGSLAVAPDDPNVIYAGLGEAPVRGVSSSWGDGMYKSTDAGRTWAHIGLGNSRQISRVIVHPRNSDIVFVAAQGSRWGASAERGVYRSMDGGKVWKLVLSVDSLTGPSDLAIDPTNPRILYAAFWDHQRLPWLVRSGGPAGGIWKSVDSGENWKRLTGGLPKIMGKIGVAVSPANPDRLWAIVEADSGGLFKSDDAGATWQLVNSDRVLRARAWYYTRVTADPMNPDVVYVINAPVMKSIDGGRTFEQMADPHGDNHDLWINPTNPQNMIKADDGGAVVSFNGGRTWSTQANQPTAQFYRVITDDRFPYWLYAGQQDNTSVAIPSAVAGPGISPNDWHQIGGCESAHVAFDPANPELVYAGCYLGIISEHEQSTAFERNVMAYPYLGLAEPSDQVKYRFNWSAPIFVSPFDPKTIYHAGNVLLKTTDRGQSWTEISPDLTRNDKSRQGRGGTPITNEGAGGEVYNTIYYGVESPHEAGTIWIGTDDGLVQLTRDGGKTWTNVTPKGLAESLINMVEVSPFDKATAYIAVSRHKWNDNTPLLYKTTDYGQSWTKLVTGIADGDVVRVVREDPTRRGLLYAGTETGPYVSTDGGLKWQRFQLNLPHVPVTDLRVKRQDLVISTEGRAFWILDDVSPLYELTDSVAKAPVHLFTPRAAYRTNLGADRSVPGLGQNAPAGAILDFHLAQAPDSATAVTLALLDGSGAVIRSFSNAPVKKGDPNAPIRLTPTAGLNRFVWDLRREPISRIPGRMLAEGGAALRVAPGTYQVRLTVGSEVRTRPLEVKRDPRTHPSAEDVVAQQEMMGRLQSRMNEVQDFTQRIGSAREQIRSLIDRTAGRPAADTIAKTGRAIIERIEGLEGTLSNTKGKTFQDVINFRNGLVDQYMNLANAVDGTEAAPTRGMRIRLDDLDRMWGTSRQQVESLLNGEVASLNALVRDRGVPAIVVPEPKSRPIP